MKRRSVRCILVAIAIPAVAFALLFGCFVWLLSARHSATRDVITFVVPGTSFKIEHSRIAPMLADHRYDRGIAFIVDGTRTTTSPLTIGTENGYPINCYLIETPKATLLRMDDESSEHVIDLTHQSVYLMWRAMGELYYGKLNSDGSSPLRNCRISNDDPFTREVTFGGAPAKPLAPISKVRPRSM